MFYFLQNICSIEIKIQSHLIQRQQILVILCLAIGHSLLFSLDCVFNSVCLLSKLTSLRVDLCGSFSELQSLSGRLSEAFFKLFLSLHGLRLLFHKIFFMVPNPYICTSLKLDICTLGASSEFPSTYCPFLLKDKPFTNIIMSSLCMISVCRSTAPPFT